MHSDTKTWANHASSFYLKQSIKILNKPKYQYNNRFETNPYQNMFVVAHRFMFANPVIGLSAVIIETKPGYRRRCYAINTDIDV